MERFQNWGRKWFVVVMVICSALYYFLVLPLMANDQSFAAGLPNLIAKAAPIVGGTIGYFAIADWQGRSVGEHGFQLVAGAFVAPFLGFWLLVYVQILLWGE